MSFNPLELDRIIKVLPSGRKIFFRSDYPNSKTVCIGAYHYYDKVNNRDLITNFRFSRMLNRQTFKNPSFPLIGIWQIKNK